MTCPRCNGSDLAKLPFVHERSLRQARSPMRPGPFATAGPAQARQHYQLTLAQRSAPPRRAAIKPLVMLGGVAIAISGFSASALMFVALLAVGLVIALRYNAVVWPRSYDLWTRKAMCGRCGTIVAPPQGPAPLVPQRAARVVSVRVEEPPH